MQMRKTTAVKSTSIEDMEQSMAVMAARKDFINGALNMGWQLAFTILVPVFIGAKLDERFNSSPSYTLAALFVAIGLAGVVVSRTFKQVIKDQADAGKEKSAK
jgi:F0F1-type ATP synthase assembly protein I